MSSRKEIIYDTISKVQTIIEESIKNELSNEVMNAIENLLDKDYLEENKTYEDRLYNAGCFGGGVWELLYNFTEYKSLLVVNYEEYQNNTRISPVLASFPYSQLDNLCEKTFCRLNDLK